MGRRSPGKKIKTVKLYHDGKHILAEIRMVYQAHRSKYIFEAHISEYDCTIVDDDCASLEAKLKTELAKKYSITWEDRLKVVFRTESPDKPPYVEPFATSGGNSGTKCVVSIHVTTVQFGRRANGETCHRESASSVYDGWPEDEDYEGGRKSRWLDDGITIYLPADDKTKATLELVLGQFKALADQLDQLFSFKNMRKTLASVTSSAPQLVLQALPPPAPTKRKKR